MAITNGYATLAEIKDRLGFATYTSTGISFTSGTKTIADTGLGLYSFKTGDIITVSGSTSNDGSYTVATGGVAASIVTSEALTTEAAGDTVTITVTTVQTDDAKLERMVEATSRAIDEYTGRHFYTQTATARYFTAQEGDFLEVDDLLSIDTDGLVTDADGDRTYETTWGTTDYDRCPYNAAGVSKPYTWLETTPGGIYSFPTVAKGVKITGTWGYASSTPPAIKEACLLVAVHNFPA
jgi:hypothetical protein